MARRRISEILIILFFFVKIHGQSRDSVASFIEIPVAPVPASFPVNFALYTTDDWQFVAFYDTAHFMTLAQRKLDQKSWSFQTLPSKIAWDSHNYLSLVIDNNGIIHLVGNMHSSPLIYYRSIKAYDIHTMQSVNRMTGKEEDITTYPEFMTGPTGKLIFHYRYGVSGSGYEIFNQWDLEYGKWSRLSDKPLTDGQGKMNAYIQGPLLGPDNFFHMLWVWRDTPDCATNHTLSYARSSDLLNWQSITGEKIALPITFADKETWVDSTSVYGGLINIGIKTGFDINGNVLAGYHKYDTNGNTQLYMARFENKLWRSYQVSDWDYRWDFKGYGTIENDLLIEPPRACPQRKEIVFAFHHITYGDGQFVLDNSTLQVKRIEAFETNYPKVLDIVKSPVTGMQVNKILGRNINGKNKYLLRWETLGPNRDKVPDRQRLPSSLLTVIEY